MKMISLLIVLSCLAALAATPSFAGPDDATLEAGWMYLSTATDHYDPGLDEPRWDSGYKEIYLIVETPSSDWDPSVGYYGVEFSIDYPTDILLIAYSSPQAPAPLIIGTSDPGHCSFGIGTGYAVPENPWTAFLAQFLTLAPVDNVLFTLGIPDRPTPRLMGNPGWALYDVADPPLAAARTYGQGSGADHKPAWEAGFVLLNYNPATASSELLDDLSERVQDPGHPVWMSAIPTENESWGELKAGFK